MAQVGWVGCIGAVISQTINEPVLTANHS
jgi:hypothetical protein